MNKTNILSDELRVEIKKLIHEVLDERGYKNMSTYYKYTESLYDEVKSYYNYSDIELSPHDTSQE